MAGEISKAICKDGHRFFVAATVGCQKEGTATILVVCTSCGHSFAKTYKVSDGNKPLVIDEKS